MKKLFFIFLTIICFSANASIVITPTTLPNGNTGHTYYQQLTASGGAGRYVWIKKSGTLPLGTSLNVQNGLLSGVLTSTVSTVFTFTVQVTDAAAATATRGYTITIAPGELTCQQIITLWNRSTPDLGGLSDTWYSVFGADTAGGGGGGSNPFTAATYTNVINNTDSVIWRNSTTGTIYKGTLADFNNITGSINNINSGATQFFTGTDFNAIANRSLQYEFGAVGSGTPVYSLTSGLNTGGGVKYLYDAGGSTGNVRDSVGGTHRIYSAGLLTVSSPTSSVTGLLGVGTSTPAAKLEVVGTGTTSATKALQADNLSKTNLFYVQNNGNAYHSNYLGLGTTSPQYNLDVRGIHDIGDGFACSARFQNTKIDNEVYLKLVGSTDSTYFGQTVGTIFFLYRGGIKFRVNNGGNVIASGTGQFGPTGIGGVPDVSHTLTVYDISGNEATIDMINSNTYSPGHFTWGVASSASVHAVQNSLYLYDHSANGVIFQADSNGILCTKQNSTTAKAITRLDVRKGTIKWAPLTSTYTVSTTLNVDSLANGMAKVTTGTVTLTTPTASAITTKMQDNPGQSFFFTIKNSSSQSVTIALGSGVSVSTYPSIPDAGELVLLASSVGNWIFTEYDSSNWIIKRLD